MNTTTKDHAQYVGQTPSVVLIDPKYAHNVGAVVRAASCYGIRQVWYTGERVAIEVNARKRLPREERMRGYQEVELINYDYPFDMLPAGSVPVAVEVRPGMELLPNFEHPEKAVYVFGPEDGSIPPSVMRHCHRFVIIPSRHCLNLAAAVYTVLYDRVYKHYVSGEEELPVLSENRGFVVDMEREAQELKESRE